MRRVAKNNNSNHSREKANTWKNNNRAELPTGDLNKRLKPKISESNTCDKQ